MKLGASTRPDLLVGAAIIIFVPLVAGVVALGGKLGIMAVGGLIALAVGVYVGLRHPLWLYWGMAIAVGSLPFGYFPGVHLPLY
ncbi:MAG: hypothetical protein K2Y33_06140, partial [Mycolicibacterium frederiksbergense]|nr:hypothetical protein [Mycolicibacterium frederiksbergense]